MDDFDREFGIFENMEKDKTDTKQINPFQKYLWDQSVSMEIQKRMKMPFDTNFFK